jgi:electron transport complex protein RnfB
MNHESHHEQAGSRRDWFRDALRGGALGGLGLGVAWLMWPRRSKSNESPSERPTTPRLSASSGRREQRPTEWVWQIDPDQCVACGNCATHCVLDESAVKCVHSFPMCGYCELCTGYFEPDPIALNAGAENQLCPTGAIVRKFIEDPYFEYHIDEPLCIGCGKCVKGCTTFGNGSLYLQVMHDRCENCNECAIAVACPSRAFRRVPADRPYLLKNQQDDA